MRAALARHRDAGVTKVICGEIFLEDVRRYREERLLGDGLTGVFPLWQRDTREMARQFIRLGYLAVLCCARIAWATAIFYPFQMLDGRNRQERIDYKLE